MEETAVMAKDERMEFRRTGEPYPIRYIALVNGEQVGEVYKYWYEGDRGARVFLWATDPWTGLHKSRQEAAAALLEVSR